MNQSQSTYRKRNYHGEKKQSANARTRSARYTTSTTKTGNAAGRRPVLCTG